MRSGRARTADDQGALCFAHSTTLKSALSLPKNSNPTATSTPDTGIHLLELSDESNTNLGVINTRSELVCTTHFRIRLSRVHNLGAHQTS
jgi:hypothetical protein